VGQGLPVLENFKKDFRWKGAGEVIPALPEPLTVEFSTDGTIQKISKNEGFRFVYFGRLVPHKGVEHLIKNWHRLQRHSGKLDVYGSGSQKNELENLVQRMGLSDRIRFLGRYPSGGQLTKLLANYDLKLLPTIGDEGAPLVLLEAMACGLPFVANGVGGIPDYANPDCEITDGDLSSFFDLVDVQVEKMRAGQFIPFRLQDHYQANFSTEVLADRWSQYITRTCSEPTARSESKA
jgi:glycosyltransferase involved in cell wall biosynthesis